MQDTSRKDELWAGIGKSAVLIVITAFLAWAAYGQRFQLNDEKYFLWHWRHLPDREICSIALIAGLPFFLGQWVYLRWPRLVPIALGLVTLSSLLLMILHLRLEFVAPDHTPITTKMFTRMDGGYFPQAALYVYDGGTIRQLLSHYPQFMQQSYGHVYNKPPGNILFCIFNVYIFGATQNCAEIVGWMIGILGSLAVLATYLFILFCCRNRNAAFLGASFLALCPSQWVFFPSFDECYPIFTSAMVLFWAMSLQRDSIKYSAAFGLMFAIALFFTYLPAVLVFFFVGHALLVVNRHSKPDWPHVVRTIAIAVVFFLGFYVALWLTTGFTPIATFRAAIQQEHVRMQALYSEMGWPMRKLPGTIPWDLYSFALGTGWISFVLIVFFFQAAWDGRFSGPQTRIALLCIGQIAFVAVTGLIQAETARVWIFMLPLLMLPIGLEISRWNIAGRMCVYACILVLATAIDQSMLFLR